MARIKIKFNRDHGQQIMKSRAMRKVLDAETSRTMTALPEAGDGYESIVENGGDRLRGAVWTVTNKAKARTARDGELLTALLGGGE
ncbi:hypothetical protein [Gordonia sp. DT101]|uniref:hypothetical protein n=1 Tax=Gordonia sp. DT101 TaxID=3416545 RepID=UPI003CF21EB3